MSLSLLRQLWAVRRSEILGDGIADCHARGLDSIVLLREPMIRMFVTRPGHELHRNLQDCGPLSIAFHPHHCDVALEILTGSICNRLVVKGGRARLTMYRYHSQLRGEAPGFEAVASMLGLTFCSRYLLEGDSIDLPARSAHTVGVLPDEQAAWLVYEGTEDPGYRSICLSDADLVNADFTGMYRPMSATEVDDAIEGVLARASGASQRREAARRAG